MERDDLSWWFSKRGRDIRYLDPVPIRREVVLSHLKFVNFGRHLLTVINSVLSMRMVEKKLGETLFLTPRQRYTSKLWETILGQTDS